MIETDKTIAIIPARGGSKGIPGKNIRAVAGSPLISWTIRAALKASSISRVIVSTDDDEIAAVALAEHAEVVRRPQELADDNASSEAALLHVLETLHDRGEKESPAIAFLQCTSPLTLPADIDGTVAAVLRDNADCAFTAARTHRFLWRYDEHGNATGINHEVAKRQRRQDRAREFVETGAVYAMRTSGFRSAKHRFFGRVAIYEVPTTRSLEVDDPDDLLLADFLLQKLQTPQSQAVLKTKLPADLRALAFDFDGVFTDNRVSQHQDGTESVTCSRSDGWGVGQLRKSGWPMVVISTERNPVVAARCKKLQIDCLHGVDDKPSALEAWAARKGINLEQTLFLGNDYNDLAVLNAVGCPAVVADAPGPLKALAHVVLHANGGNHAVRELADLIDIQFPGGPSV